MLQDLPPRSVLGAHTEPTPVNADKPSRSLKANRTFMLKFKRFSTALIYGGLFLLIAGLLSTALPGYAQTSRGMILLGMLVFGIGLLTYFKGPERCDSLGFSRSGPNDRFHV